MPSDLQLQALVESIRDAAAADPVGVAEALAPVLAHVAPAPAVEVAPARRGWTDTTGAAAYLGLSRNALNKLASARLVPFEQDVRGGKRWFNYDDLDGWRRSGARRAA